MVQVVPLNNLPNLHFYGADWQDQSQIGGLRQATACMFWVTWLHA